MGLCVARDVSTNLLCLTRENGNSNSNSNNNSNKPRKKSGCVRKSVCPSDMVGFLLTLRTTIPNFC